MQIKCCENSSSGSLESSYLGRISAHGNKLITVPMSKLNRVTLKTPLASTNAIETDLKIGINFQI